MGSGQSVRATHFSRPSTQSPPPGEPEERHISISNKMVERLVEDASLAGGAAAVEPVSPKPRGDFKETIYTEKIKCLDESHSEKNKITVDDLNSLIRRIDIRASNMMTDEVCPDYQQRIIDCYNEAAEAGDVVKCWTTIGDFSQCVQQAGAERLQARTRAAAAESAQRERRVKHAREYALRDLKPPPE